MKKSKKKPTPEGPESLPTAAEQAAEVLRLLALDPKAPATARVSAARAILGLGDGAELESSTDRARAALTELIS